VHRGAGVGARGRGGRPQNDSSKLRFDGEFDFETSNAQFDKEQIEKELKEKLTISKFCYVFNYCCSAVN
jgi:FDF domain